MKQKDIALIAVIAIVGGVVSLLLSNALFSSPAKHQTKIEVVQAIDSSFAAPDPKYFNKDSFDPTRVISISPNDNTAPFSAKTAQ